MSRRIVRGERDGAEGDLGRGIEHPQPETGDEEPLQRLVDFGLADEVLTNSIRKARILRATAEVCPCLHRDGSGVSHVSSKLMSCSDIGDGDAVRDDWAVESPGLSQ